MQPAVLEYLDDGALAASIGSLPVRRAAGDPAFAVIAEIDGSGAEVDGRRRARRRDSGWGARAMRSGVTGSRDARALWGWRDGVSIAVNAQRGGKVSEDIVVPVDRLADAIDGTRAIGERHELPACSWGHAGDGNIHASFLVEPGDRRSSSHVPSGRRARSFDLAIELGGSISGEHGIGSLKTGWVRSALGQTLAPASGRHQEDLRPETAAQPGQEDPAPRALTRPGSDWERMIGPAPTACR